MSDNLYQVGVAAIRGPDGKVIDQVPLCRPRTEADAAAERSALRDLAKSIVNHDAMRSSLNKMAAAARRNHIKI